MNFEQLKQLDKQRRDKSKLAYVKFNNPKSANMTLQRTLLIIPSVGDRLPFMPYRKVSMFGVKFPEITGNKFCWDLKVPYAFHENEKSLIERSIDAHRAKYPKGTKDPLRDLKLGLFFKMGIISFKQKSIKNKTLEFDTDLHKVKGEGPYPGIFEAHEKLMGSIRNLVLNYGSEEESASSVGPEAAGWPLFLSGERRLALKLTRNGHPEDTQSRINISEAIEFTIDEAADYFDLLDPIDLGVRTSRVLDQYAIAKHFDLPISLTEEDEARMEREHSDARERGENSAAPPPPPPPPPPPSDPDASDIPF